MVLPDKSDMQERLYRKRKTLHEVISMSATGLFVGEQTRDILCPVCFGGGTKEKSFSIRREEGRILYKCWRASCGIKGVLNSLGSLVTDHHPTDLKEVFTGRRYSSMLGPLTLEGQKLFHDKFGLTLDDLHEARVSYAPQEDRYAFPVNSPSYQARGYIVRSFHNNKTKWPKWDAFQNLSGGVGNPWQGWYIRIKPPYDFSHRKVVVVEDPISALKISRHFRSCFLNGTNLDLEKLLEIHKVAGNYGMVFALDKDATAKAIDLVRQYQFFVGNQATCVHLEKDAKYMSDDEIVAAFGTKAPKKDEKKEDEIPV